jgi:DNA-binding winged helix-turn-helix (wHTH) protein
MPGDPPYSRLPAVPPLSPLRLIPQRAKRRLKQLGHTLRHTLRLSSSVLLLAHGSSTQHSRLIPSAWGARRDEYRWTRGHRDDISLFRETATGVASLLVHQPIAAWADLLPGAMDGVIGNASNLYLADYWTFTLHHLVWSGKLPYAVNARWERGGKVDDDPFYFVSELPTDLAEASREALILFEESAAREIKDAASFVEQFTRPLDLRPYGLPIYDDGQWRLPERRDEPIAPASAVDATETQTERAPEAHNAAADSNDTASAKMESDDAPVTMEADLPSPDSCDEQPPILDDQAFTVRHGGRSYRFTARNKQLFGLLERVSRRPGYRVLYNDLRSIGDVWDGASVEDSTIRGAVARLRKLLTTQRMAGLSSRIITGTYRGNGYVMLRVGEADEDP